MAEDEFQGLRATGTGANGNDLFRTTLAGKDIRRRCHVAAWQCGRWANTGTGRNFDRLDDVLGVSLQEIPHPRLRFGDDLHRAGGQGIDGKLRARFR